MLLDENDPFPSYQVLILFLLQRFICFNLFSSFPLFDFHSEQEMCFVA